MGVVSSTSSRSFYQPPHDQLLLKLNSRSDIVDVCGTLAAAGVQPDAVSCENQLTKYVWVQANNHNKNVVLSPALKNHLSPTIYRSPGEYQHQFTSQQEVDQFISRINNHHSMNVNSISAPTSLGPKFVFVNRR
jgi:hypothetical protein